MIPMSNLLKWHSSLDGDVKLWDIRGGSSSLDGWKMFPEGLSTFDMHDQCGVYAGQVVHVVQCDLKLISFIIQILFYHVFAMAPTNDSYTCSIS